MPSNGTIAIGVLCDLDVNFQGQTFSCYAVSINNGVDSGRPRQICFYWHGHSRGVGLVYLNPTNIKLESHERLSALRRGQDNITGCIAYL